MATELGAAASCRSDQGMGLRGSTVQYVGVLHGP
jgi:hypothetical protein